MVSNALLSRCRRHPGDELTVFDGHVAAVNCVQLLDDGGLVSGGADNLVKVTARWGKRGGVSFPVW